MKHFTMEDEIDFVNQVVPTTRKIAMERHLKDCRRCAKAVSQWQRARQCAAAEPSYQPPQEAVRIAKAAFAGLQLALHREPAGSSIELVFDSFLHAPLQGFRSAGSGTRQLLYRADPFQIDLHIEVEPGDKNVGLILANLCGRVVRTVTNQFGEFRAEIENSGDLALVFFRADHKPVVIPLQDGLSQSSDEERKHPGR